MWNLFKVNNKGFRTTSLISLWCFYRTDFTQCSDVSIAEFEQVDAASKYSSKKVCRFEKDMTSADTLSPHTTLHKRKPEYKHIFPQFLLIISSSYLLHLFFNPSRHDPGEREKINLNFYFQTSLYCIKRFYAGLKGRNFYFNATFWNARGGKG